MSVSTPHAQFSNMSNRHPLYKTPLYKQQKTNLHQEMILKIHDSKIGAENYTITIRIGDYLKIADKIIGANQYQRKRVKHSATVYSLLKKDMIEGCVIPPIVLAYTGGVEIDEDNICEFLLGQASSLVILDGLQRTFTLIDAREDLANQDSLFQDNRLTNEFLERKTRLEFYAGINRIGILYRMLTLNTGQTPMTLRQQVEMLYFDYADKAPAGVSFIKEVDGNEESKIGKYHFKDIIDGFLSYLERNELPIDRFDILDSIKNLKSISNENKESDIFEDFTLAYHAFIEKIHALAGDIELNEVDLGIKGMPFGTNVFAIFSKPQALSGFGAALGKLKESGLINGFSDIQEKLDALKLEESPEGFLLELLGRLEEIRNTSKKIGNAQRMYFQYFFRALFNKSSETHLNIPKSVSDAHQKYMSQVS